MSQQTRKMSDIMKEMSERLLHRPNDAHSSEAAHVALMFANIAWNKGEVQTVVEEIADLVDAFCREHLNDEYAVLCRKLTEKLARKRPSPLVKGKTATWASGIVRTIGWVNFLYDKPKRLTCGCATSTLRSELARAAGRRNLRRSESC